LLLLDDQLDFAPAAASADDEDVFDGSLAATEDAAAAVPAFNPAPT
jgi:hypothetical protein